MAYVDKINDNNVDYDIQDSKAARSVDGTTASHVELTNQIYTTSTQSTVSSFIYRTTAGDVSIETGEATLQYIEGNTVQTGHTDEKLTMNTSFADPDTTATLDKPTWRSYVAVDGIYEFVHHGSKWQLNGNDVTLSNYGITVTGTPDNDDIITVNYVQLVVGSLSTASPSAFVATGFNQYDAVAGYAHVKGDNQYRIAGTYTSLGFTTTIGGATTTVTVTDNKFTPTEDGYIYVNGASGDILIALVWSGTMDSEPFSAYSTSSITIPTKDASNNNLPTATYGMPSVHGVADRLSFADKAYIQKIGHYTYSAENLATVEALGVDYWYDNSDIFYVLASPVTYTLAGTVSGAYTANDYGTEEFTGTSVDVIVAIVYGNSLVDKLRNMLPIQSVGTGLTLTGTELSVSGGGGDTVYSTKTTSNSATGGAVYIGNLGADQTPVLDPSPNDNHYKYFWALPFSNNGTTYGQPGNGTVNILGSTKGVYSVAIGYNAGSGSYGCRNAVMIGADANIGNSGIAIGFNAGTSQDSQGNVCIGDGAGTTFYQINNSVAIGRGAKAARSGEVNVGANDTNFGYNSTNYRVIGGVHDGQDAHDAVTVEQVNATIDAINTALSTSIPHIGAQS